MVSHSNHDLSPLGAKFTGFRLVIPDPIEIATWVKQTCAFQANMPPSEILKINEAAWEKFRLRLSRRMVSGQRVWMLPFVADTLLDSIEVVMRTAYSPNHGDWCDIVAYLSLAPEALTEGLQWTLPCKASEIAAQLRHDGLDVSLRPDEDQSQGLLVANSQGGSAIDVCLGFKTYIDALAGDFEAYVQPDIDEDRIFAFIDDLVLSPQGLLKDLLHFQVTLSYLVDNLYLVTNRQPPDVVMELSAFTEMM